MAQGLTLPGHSDDHDAEAARLGDKEVTEGAMRQGFRVIDSDTHVNPSLDVLLRYADSDLRERLDDLQPYTRMAKPQPGRGDAEDVEAYATLSIKPVRLQRVAGEKPGPAAPVGADRGFLSGRTQMVTRQIGRASCRERVSSVV